MHPEQQSTPQEPTAAQPAQAPVPPIAQFDCWYIPEGSYTVFGYRKSTIVLYPGLMMVYRKSDNAELARIQLAPDLRMKYFLGFVRIAQVNGHKSSMFKLNNVFMTTPVWIYGIFFVGVLLNFVNDIGRTNTGGRNVGIQLLALLAMLGAVGLLAMGIPKAKAIIAAAKRAAGIAS